jgi:hypothetical protein
MTNCDFFSLHDKSTRESHTSNERASGERDYIEHVRTHILSAGERLVVFLVVALLTGVAVGGHFSHPAAAQRPAPVTSERLSDWHYYNNTHCEEESPYSGRSC